MKVSVVLLIMLGLVAAVCAALLVSFAMTRGGPPARAPPGQAGPVPDAPVTLLLPRPALPARTVIDADCVGRVQVPRSKAPADAFANPVQITGRPLSLPMVSGQAFTASCFAAEGSRAKFASILPNGQRAFAINITDYGALAV